MAKIRKTALSGEMTFTDLAELRRKALSAHEVKFTFSWARQRKRLQRWADSFQPLPGRVLYYGFLVPAYHIGLWLGTCVAAASNLWWAVRAGVVDGYRENVIERR